MAAGNRFLSRVFQHLLNDLIVDRLANNHSFQRFAVRSSKAIEDITEQATKKKQQLLEQLKDLSKQFQSKV